MGDSERCICGALCRVRGGMGRHGRFEFVSEWNLVRLRIGMHDNKLMQAAWNSQGAEAFQFEVLASLDDDVAPMLIRDSLREGQKHWMKELGARQV